MATQQAGVQVQVQTAQVVVITWAPNEAGRTRGLQERPLAAAVFPDENDERAALTALAALVEAERSIDTTQVR